jgi:hypothetical protein
LKYALKKTKERYKSLNRTDKLTYELAFMKIQILNLEINRHTDRWTNKKKEFEMYRCLTNREMNQKRFLILEMNYQTGR